ncbi:MAG TPA: aspartate carbamoyltransferase regulatory subunit [Candidatus Magasanikbacteria bacterium]|nr:MAG: aspartate carbamoyltransferase regulatory subunit [Candidatus Magasanikbacteria bacterium RIFCSPLOWO2_02_FULL_47_16]OGH79864.1 MAG: aspartate carbamoyltransferase regulatory subunit [Candidatus Magasanikbacteria bacterium RIFCSPHIGHO2_02_FULL_48_18]OGH82104.1 MAG: aspartate carbamoyltransferase regulatory subunit [Candidatus Magasanikbacteria bacterium RIFCSPLOWO2_12_FULL_47_9b]HAZ28878.1 aspartate carbamoyltransferase regulatory subunit [Candidatus Magasanikbacteria bacterium]
MRAYKVFAIKDGTVIDHIPSGKAFALIELLGLHKSDSIVTMGTHFRSKKIGKKDIVKIEHKELSPEEVNQVSLIAPSASINIIRNFKVAKKFIITIPPVFKDIITCPNPKCITNSESAPSKFYSKMKNGHLALRCHYCEKIYMQEELHR